MTDRVKVIIGEMTNKVISHFEPELPDPNHWIKIQQVIRGKRVGEIQYYDFDRIISGLWTEDTMEDALRAGEFIKIENPPVYNPAKCLWLAQNGKIYYADKECPTEDRKRIPLGVVPDHYRIVFVSEGIVSHYFPSLTSRYYWRNLEFIVRSGEDDKAVFHQNGFYSEKLSEETIEEKVLQGKIIAISNPPEFHRKKVVWVTPDGKLIYASRKDPTQDKEKIEIGQIPKEHLLCY